MADRIRKRSTKPCTAPGCTNRQDAHGLCANHNRRMREYGSLDLPEKVITICSVEDCDRVAAVRGWCEKHYLRWKRHGDVEYTRPRQADESCSVTGCRSSAECKTLCKAHYSRLVRNGDPLGGRETRNGTSTTYAAVHGRLRKERKPAPGYPCVEDGCTNQAAEWSYDHGCLDEMPSHLTDSPYCVHIWEHYSPRCGACHRRYDHGG